MKSASRWPHSQQCVPTSAPCGICHPSLRPLVLPLPLMLLHLHVALSYCCLLSLSGSSGLCCKGSWHGCVFGSLVDALQPLCVFDRNAHINPRTKEKKANKRTRLPPRRPLFSPWALIPVLLGVSFPSLSCLQEHEVPHVFPHYRDKAYVVLQSNAAAAMQTCGYQKQCAPRIF